jgi:hypothetical protein
MPPLIRALMEAFLEDAGVHEPRVDQSGRVVHLVYDREEQLRDPAFIMQAAIQTDLALEVLTGERPRFGRETVERLSNQAGIDDTEGFYQERRGILHDSVSPELLRDALKRARRMTWHRSSTARNAGSRHDGN